MKRCLLETLFGCNKFLVNSKETNSYSQLIFFMNMCPKIYIRFGALYKIKNKDQTILSMDDISFSIKCL